MFLSSAAPHWAARLFSAHCWLCYSALRQHSAVSETHAHTHQSYFCSTCRQALPLIKQACYHCGIPLQSELALSCARCLQRPPAFQRCVCIWHFRAEIIEMVHAFKYRERLDLGKAMSLELSQSIAACYSTDTLPQGLVPVPLHRKRLSERGFNQAQCIAAHLADRFKLPLYTRLIARRINTPSQQQLSARQREKNLSDAFVAARKKTPAHIQGAHLALIDDVVTTTSTAQAAAKCLLAMGAARVDVWALARVGTA